MKKFFCIVFSALILFSVATVSSFAQMAGELTFGLTNSGASYAVSGAAGVSGDVVIPSTYNGKAVTGVMQSAFKLNSGVTSVTLPSSITYVGNYAFELCTNLGSVVFQGADCVIADGAFRGCGALKSVTLPSSLEKISNKVFADCVLLETVNVPEGIESIGESAFLNCSALTSFTIPASVSEINPGAFVGCKGVAGFSVAAGSTKFTAADGVLFDSDKTLIAYPEGKTANNYTVPAGTLKIGELAFSGNTKIKKIVLPGGIDEISDEAFINCKYLETITFPSSLKTIGSLAFGYCDALSVVIIPQSVTKFDSAFYKSGVQTASFDFGLTKIGETAFQGCEKLSAVIIPISVSEIGKGAFCDCPSLKTVTVPYQNCSAGVDAFGGTTDALIIPSKVEVIPAAAEISVNSTYTFGLNVFPDFADKSAVVWESSDESVATVSPSGAATAVKSGECVITASVPGTQATSSATLSVDPPRFKIAEYSTSQINFGDTLILHADCSRFPSGSRIVWSVDGEYVTISPSQDGLTCAVTSKSSGNVTVTAKLVDASGKVIKGTGGYDCISSAELVSRAGFIQKLINFFKNLFGANRVIPQVFKTY